MISKNFRIHSVVRILLITLSALLLMYLVLETTVYTAMALVGAAIILQLCSLISYVETVTRDTARFLTSIKYSDFSISHTEGMGGKAFRELNDAFSQVASEFKKANAEKEEQYSYIRTLVEHIGTGIISFDSDGKIDLINKAVKRLLKIGHINNIYSLDPQLKPLLNALLSDRTGEKILVRMDIEGESITLAVITTRLKLRNRRLTLASIQNIDSELAEGEMEAWQKLIRILSHEIMNSVTPIASLSSTAKNLVTDITSEQENADAPMDRDARDDLVDAIITIEKRSQGLLNFVNSYKNLTSIPEPNVSVFPVRELLLRIEQLMSDKIKANGIDLSISINPESLRLTADLDLVEQVILNLLQNSINAVQTSEHPRIELKSWRDEKGRVNISVTDNGPGIPEELREKIFTPFFSTQKEGSGVGLSLSRQIMRKHNGTISVKSTPHVMTTVTLQFRDPMRRGKLMS